jgi:hypothetical protein
MRFQRVAKDTRSTGKVWEGFMPEETKAHIAEQAEDLVRPISEGRLGRPCWPRLRASCAIRPWPRSHGSPTC